MEEKDNYVMVTKDIHEILLMIGIPTQVTGFAYLTSAIELVLKDPCEMQKYTGLYAEVAHKHHSSIAKVERAIRHAIETACQNGNVELIDSLFKYSIKPSKGAPTNSQFISRLFFYISEKGN